jgi:hypothetical protein
MFDFPNSPTIGQQVIEPNGAAVQWDGTKWASVAGQVSSVAPLYNNIGRNLIHNSMFNIAQRGSAAFSTVGYTLDRWRLDFSLDTTAVQQIDNDDAHRTQIGDEAATKLMYVSVTGNSGAGAFTVVSQFMEDVRRLAGKTVTVSFWAYATAGTPKIGVAAQQYFGTGGSPSAAVSINGTPITLSTTAMRYSVTFTYPSIIGKTVGTNPDHYSRLALFFSSGASNNAFAGGIGVQTANFILWGVQLEIGSTMTPLEKLDPRIELSNCQRFFERKSLLLNEGLGVGTVQTVSSPVTAYFIMVPYKVTKRAVPTTTMSAPNTFTVAGLACSNVSVGASTNAAWMHFAATGGNTGANWAAVPVASDGSLPAYIDFSADL